MVTPVRVALLALGELPDWQGVTGFSYPTARSFLVSPVLPGKYADYGNVRLDAPLDEVSVTCFSAAGVVLDEDGELSSAVLRDKDEARNAVPEGKRSRRIGTWIVHEAVYEQLVRHTFGDVVPRASIMNIEELRAAADETVTYVGSVEKHDGTNESLMRQAMALGSEMREHGILKLADGMDVNLHIGWRSLLAKIRDHRLSDEERRPYAYAVADGVRLYHAMVVMRRDFDVCSGAGGYDNDPDPHMAMAQVVLDMGRALKAKYDDYGLVEENGDEDKNEPLLNAPSP